jgi:hypothetical protein
MIRSNNAIMALRGLIMVFTIHLGFSFVPTVTNVLSRRPIALGLTRDDDFTFDGMKKVDNRLKLIEEIAPEFLLDYYEPNLNSFSIKPGSTTRLSITSTCYSLQAILASGQQRFANELEISSILKALLDSAWKEDDIYQVSLLLLMLLRADPSKSFLLGLDFQMASKFSQLLPLVLKARPKRRTGADQKLSDYLSYVCCSVYSLLQDGTHRDRNGNLLVGGLPSRLISDDAASEISLALSRAAEASFNELCRQMAYRAAGDTSSFDLIRLVYSLLTYWKSTASLQGTAGRELVPGMGPAIGTESVQLNMRLVKAALAAVFEEQGEDGLWDRGQPIYKSFRRKGRNIGNAYVFSIDALASLLNNLPAEEFRPYLPQLEKALGWIETHQGVEVNPDYCDPETGQCYGKSLRGWASPHLTPGTGPQAWSTAQTICCVTQMRRTIRQLLHNDVLEEFNGISVSKKGSTSVGWDRLLDSDLGIPGECRTIKAVLEERVLVPFEESVSNPSYGAAYSTILFGSPGTAKTTITEAVAEKMGWDFVVIDTAAFLEDGLTNVASRIRYVFTRLQALRNCVILFDEIEEFCLDRETPGISMESRMLTTAMLTAINDLRRTKQSVFFVATNRLRAFDAAIIRPGRFDMQLFVGMPNLEARVILCQQALSSVSAPAESKEKAIDTYREFLQSVWSEDGDVMFMNYLESRQFATSIARIVENGVDLDEEELTRILRLQAAVMTCRGTVRDEYKAQVGLSRF